jgi:hypothetical protein
MSFPTKSSSDTSPLSALDTNFQAIPPAQPQDAPLELMGSPILASSDTQGLTASPTDARKNRASAEPGEDIEEWERISGEKGLGREFVEVCVETRESMVSNGRSKS